MNRKIPQDAFEFYHSMGPGRSYQAVADQYGVTKRAVTDFAKREGWSQRLEAIEREAREQSDKKIAETLEEIRNRHLKTLRAMNARALSALQQFPLNSGMEAMRAAEMVIKLERLIVGEPSERTEVGIEEITRREVARFLEVAVDCEDEDEEDEDDEDAS